LATSEEPDPLGLERLDSGLADALGARVSAAEGLAVLKVAVSPAREEKRRVWMPDLLPAAYRQFEPLLAGPSRSGTEEQRYGHGIPSTWELLSDAPLVPTTTDRIE